MKWLSYCGLMCNTCPIYLATKDENKQELIRQRAEIARLCKEQYGLDYKMADITDCGGCTTVGGRLFSGCKDCAIRNCAQQKAVANCAYCADHVCDKLEIFFTKDPEAKRRSEEGGNRMTGF